MNKQNKIKTRILQATFLLVTLIVSSCGSDYTSEDSKKSAEQKNDTTLKQYEEQRDAQFLVDAAALNLEGIHLGRLAQEKGSAMHVKDLGKLMADDHTTSQRGLVTLANSKGISIPTQPTNRAKDTYTLLNSKSGKDFDLFYSDLMVKEHEDAIDKFEKAVIECTDSDIKNWATSELSLLRNHLLHALECKNKCLQNQ